MSTNDENSENKITKVEKKDPLFSGPVGTGVFGGIIAGLASHYFADGKMTFPIFIIAYIFILSGLKGKGKLVGLLVFTAIAALVVVLCQHLKL